MRKNELQEKKRRDAAERNERWSALTPEEQVAHLDRLKLTARKQRAKIQKIMEKNKKKSSGGGGVG